MMRYTVYPTQALQAPTITPSLVPNPSRPCDNDAGPKPVEQPQTLPLTALLKQYAPKISARKANNILREHGLLMTLYRPSLSHFDSYRKVNVLTAKGLQFGRNNRSPVHPIQTSPTYYPSMFAQLCRLCHLS